MKENSVEVKKVSEREGRIGVSPRNRTLQTGKKLAES